MILKDIIHVFDTIKHDSAGHAGSVCPYFDRFYQNWSMFAIKLIDLMKIEISSFVWVDGNHYLLSFRWSLSAFCTLEH